MFTRESFLFWEAFHKHLAAPAPAGTTKPPLHVLTCGNTDVL